MQIERVNLIERVPLIVPAHGARVRGDWSVSFSQPIRRKKTGTIYGWEKWTDRFKNLVVTQGLTDLLDVTLSGGAQDTTWFVGLTDGTPTVAAADTLASHAGWVEVTAYDEVNRVAFVDAGASGAPPSLGNAASPAVFTISANGTTIGGAFLAGVNTGTGGRLYAGGAFGSGDVVLNDGATLDVSAAFSMADDAV